MFNKRDAYLYQEYLTLMKTTKDGSKAIGTLFLEYQVTLYNDVQLTNAAAVDQPKNQQFILHCTKKIAITNPTASDLVIDETNAELLYENYPALLNTIMSIENANGESIKAQLLDYSPKTINTAVNVSGSTGQSDGKTSGTSNSSTVGSSTAQTNSYSASVSVGSSGLSPTSSATATAEHSTTVTHEKSNTSGSESSNSSGHESSLSESMSIKDWGAYSFINPLNKMPYWTFGQEVPWNAIKCRTASSPEATNEFDQIELAIPTAMKAALYDGVCLYPPSELSAFGFSFIARASWKLTINNADSDTVVIDHDINYYSASHSLDENDKVQVYRDQSPNQLSVANDESLSTIISLNMMSLDPLGNSPIAAIVGFIPSKFIRLPANANTASDYPTAFKIISTTNELMIQDATEYQAGSSVGFYVLQTYLATLFSASCPILKITMYFKVTDLIEDYRIFFKHWKTGTEDIMLTLIINDDTENPITKYVDAPEGEGGENNLLSISLRNQDYTSIEYHDYLQLGLNSIQMTIQPVNPINYDTESGSQQLSVTAGYAVRAISIEKS